MNFRVLAFVVLADLASAQIDWTKFAWYGKPTIIPKRDRAALHSADFHDFPEKGFQPSPEQDDESTEELAHMNRNLKKYEKVKTSIAIHTKKDIDQIEALSAREQQELADDMEPTDRKMPFPKKSQYLKDYNVDENLTMPVHVQKPKYNGKVHKFKPTKNTNFEQASSLSELKNLKKEKDFWETRVIEAQAMGTNDDDPTDTSELSIPSLEEIYAKQQYWEEKLVRAASVGAHQDILDEAESQIAILTKQALDLDLAQEKATEEAAQVRLVESQAARQRMKAGASVASRSLAVKRHNKEERSTAKRSVKTEGQSKASRDERRQAKALEIQQKMEVRHLDIKVPKANREADREANRVAAMKRLQMEKREAHLTVTVPSI